MNPHHHYRIACVVGARPNFVKMAPLLKQLQSRNVDCTLIHTGQHYDQNLSNVFFDELEIRQPDISLGVGSGTHAQQTARVLEAIEPVLVDGKFDMLVVVGDVNSTMAATLAASKIGLPVAHVEAGLRSFDRTMPEEINRIVTDSIADLLLVSEPAGMDNLRNEGHDEARIKLVGNIMIDTLVARLPAARDREVPQRLGLPEGGYAVVTLHRPSNVDQQDCLKPIIDALIEIAAAMPIVFPVHPRTEKRMRDFGLWDSFASSPGVMITQPLGYLDFLSLTSAAKMIITDSGGLQEESTALGIPCLTMRENTERPITVTEGTSTLIGSDTEQLRELSQQVLSGTYKTGVCPALWDGAAAARIAECLLVAIDRADVPGNEPATVT